MEPEFGPELDIHTACSLGDEEYVKEILDKGNVDIDAPNERGWTALMYACWGGHEGVVGLLQGVGAKGGTLGSHGQTALQVSVRGGSLPVVKLTVQKDILDHMDNYGKTALYYAVEFGFHDITGILLSHGADPNVSLRGMTPLMVAAEEGNSPVVELLLAYGAHIFVKNRQGFTAAQLAIRQSHCHVAHLLESRLTDFVDLKSFLESLTLEKYYPMFENHGIDLQGFLKMNEDDLKALGIKLLGPRRKMALAIAAAVKRRHTM